MTAFGDALAVVLREEGGFVDDPDDPGGATKWGISLRFLRRIDPGADAETIRNLSYDRMAGIYREHFWDACKCGGLPAGLSLAVFDCAVNQGPPSARKILQRAIKVKPDGYIGPVTLSAVLRADPRQVLKRFMARRAVRYAVTANFDDFGYGWMTRLMAVGAAALAAI